MNKRRNVIIMISFLFLVVATFVTVYNFKDTKANEEETNAVTESIKVTCLGGSNFVFRTDGISGCEMTQDTLKSIPGFQKYDGSSWVNISQNFELYPSGVNWFKKTIIGYKYLTTDFNDIWSYQENGVLAGLTTQSYTNTACSNNNTLCCEFKVNNINSNNALLEYRNKGDNFHMIFVPETGNDNNKFLGNFVYAFPSSTIGDSTSNDFKIDYWDYNDECKYAYNQPIVKLTIKDYDGMSSNYYKITLTGGSSGTFGDNETTTSSNHGYVYFKYNRQRENYVFGGFYNESSIKPAELVSDDIYRVKIYPGEMKVQNESLNKTYKMIEKTLNTRWWTDTTDEYDVTLDASNCSNTITCEGNDNVCKALGTDKKYTEKVFAGDSYSIPNLTLNCGNNTIKEWKNGSVTYGSGVDIDNITSNLTLSAVWNSSTGGGSDGNVSFTFSRPSANLVNCSCSGLDAACAAFNNNKNDVVVQVNSGTSFTMPRISCDKYQVKQWRGSSGNPTPGTNVLVNEGDLLTYTAEWVNSGSGGGSDDPEPTPTPPSTQYKVTLNRNCSGTFKCVSDENSEVCKGLTSSTGTYTKEVEEGDTFTFPKTFDTLTCDGKKITSWGKYNLGKQVTVNSDITANATWESSSGGGGDDVPTPGPVTYNVTLYRNCVGTFACNSTTKPEICAGLKGTDGKYVEKVNKGDKFVFPNDDDFKLLTCDGKELLSWSKYVLGESVTINSNITANATWESSNGGGDTPDPSQNDDPIDNPQTGSIVIYLVLLFGIGALVYSVWYFRGFREN